jgi:hypothetical protein
MKRLFSDPILLPFCLINIPQNFKPKEKTWKNFNIGLISWWLWVVKTSLYVSLPENKHKNYCLEMVYFCSGCDIKHCGTLLKLFSGENFKIWLVYSSWIHMFPYSIKNADRQFLCAILPKGLDFSFAQHLNTQMHWLIAF